jgi:cytidine deaminase
MDERVICDYADLPQWHALFRASLEAVSRAHAPYSKLRVGAAVLAEKGQIFAGANYESASYGLTVCAERSAILAAQAAGQVPSLKAIALVAEDPSGAFLQPSQWITPCGACRQWIFEVSSRADCDLAVLCGSQDFARVWVTSARELLPGGFG